MPGFFCVHLTFLSRRTRSTCALLVMYRDDIRRASLDGIGLWFMTGRSPDNIQDWLW
jgi:hypothetical protein